jgi:hypothetical protein
MPEFVEICVGFFPVLREENGNNNANKVNSPEKNRT